MYCIYLRGKKEKKTHKNLETMNQFRYLGIVLGSSGSFTDTVADLTDKGNRALFGLKRILTKNPYISLPLQIELFDTLILPVLSYSCEIWGFREADQLEKIHIVFF